MIELLEKIDSKNVFQVDEEVNSALSRLTVRDARIFRFALIHAPLFGSRSVSLLEATNSARYKNMTVLFLGERISMKTFDAVLQFSKMHPQNTLTLW